ncbi:hypothetical protein [Rhizohabitans arisaemae]|uniref:hypothetical protein n=1 Tax=Rhizohabitans arisaemae TaxID=2720610 RepID=UPI0024B28491|nr:hypothetical protein [Rhizohabitans arisaemae]
MSVQKRPPEDDGRDFANTAWSAPSYLISGMVIWGGAGWLLSRLTGVDAFIPIGLLVGLGLAIYLVYLKYGR